MKVALLASRIENHHYGLQETTYDKAGRITKQIIGGTEREFTWSSRADVSEILERTISSQGGTPGEDRLQVQLSSSRWHEA